MFASKRSLLAGVTTLAVLLAATAAAQSPPPLEDKRLTVHALLREDLFAGFIANDMKRLERGEKNLELLLEKRPADKAGLLAWKAGVALFRAVLAHEKDRPAEFDREYRRALDLFAQAREAGPQSGDVTAVTAGSYVLFADRLPADKRSAAWDAAYRSYQALWKQQGPVVDQLPLHLRGELLGGLAQSAQRTGRAEETQQYLDRMLTALRDSPYEPVARQWKTDPQAAAKGRLTCLSCHDPGRLDARIAALEGK